MRMMPPYSCALPGMKPGTSTNVISGMLKAVAEAHEAGAFDRGVDVEAAGHVGGLVGHDADGPAVEAGEADHEVLRPDRA